MIKTGVSAVTSVTYGLLSTLIAAGIIGSLSATGVGVESMFSAAGNAIAATMVPPNPIGTPNSLLMAFQQSQITNAAAEIAAGTASAACLQNMNNSANAASMASNNATCIGPGNGIAPPPLPVALENPPNGSVSPNGMVAVEPNGMIYATIWNGSFSTTSASASTGASAGPDSVILYNDGIEFSNSTSYPADAPKCLDGSIGYGYSGSGTPSVINGNELVCAGIMPREPYFYSPGNNKSTAAPLGYFWTW